MFQIIPMLLVELVVTEVPLCEGPETLKKQNSILYKIDILNMAEPIYKAKDDKFEVLNYMNIVLMDLAFKSAKYAKCIDIIEETKKRLKSNANFDMCIDNMLLNLWEQVN